MMASWEKQNSVKTTHKTGGSDKHHHSFQLKLHDGRWKVKPFIHSRGYYTTSSISSQPAASSSPYLRSQYPELDDALILLLSHPLCGELQPTNQVNLPPFLNLGVFSVKFIINTNNESMYNEHLQLLFNIYKNLK